jgi:hypothetical protein
VNQRDPEEQKEYKDYATHHMLIAYNKISLSDELESTTTSNPHCQNFLNEQKSLYTQYGKMDESYLTELLDATSFRIHTSGGADYVQGGTKTPGILDEVYTKIQP